MNESSKSSAGLVVCPYNLNHQVEPNLFPDHLRTCRLRYCRQSVQTLKLVRCRVNSRHFLPEIEIEFHEKLCEDQIHLQIMTELETEPIPVKIPSSDSSENDEDSDNETTTSVSSGDTDYSTSKDELLRRILDDCDAK
ncbi:hypothetical protein DICVIV_11408 [Dictyocaulus viviparus]|uniref:CHHC U11-48K-type domain-containing protein n=1 Tax=Dictyocaulus viviparus TaxID=29172 RepID=A0A0D8XFV0_DICVI|nr:hypothetical protein DICVIV_11408 [Dictyocaulus viviparus]